MKIVRLNHPMVMNRIYDSLLIQVFAMKGLKLLTVKGHQHTFASVIDSPASRRAIAHYNECKKELELIMVERYMQYLVEKGLHRDISTRKITRSISKHRYYKMVS